MPRTETKTRTLFQFDELTDSAKRKARDWYREASAGDDFGAECVYEDAAQCAEIMGIDLRTRQAKLMNGGTRMDPCIYYSGFWSQGDGACFEGSYEYAKGAAKAIRAHAPVDKELHRIADELQELQRANFYRLTATMRHRGRYYHSGCMDVDVAGNDARG